MSLELCGLYLSNTKQQKFLVCPFIILNRLHRKLLAKLAATQRSNTAKFPQEKPTSQNTSLAHEETTR